MVLAFPVLVPSTPKPSYVIVWLKNNRNPQVHSNKNSSHSSLQFRLDQWTEPSLGAALSQLQSTGLSQLWNHLLRLGWGLWGTALGTAELDTCTLLKILVSIHFNSKILSKQVKVQLRFLFVNFNTFFLNLPKTKDNFKSFCFVQFLLKLVKSTTSDLQQNLHAESIFSHIIWSVTTSNS